MTKMVKLLPRRLFICPACKYSQGYRWVLAQHLRNVHGFTRRESVEAAERFEYWLQPTSVRYRGRYIDDEEILQQFD
ncbi:MAG: hypothetical protein HQ553_11920 [Chloroflexi bacterium]|nr:hypothetical protein [Chloroflexota bacterium]